MPRGQGRAEGGDLVGGRYRLVSVIGSGGMGTVWRAHDELLDRPVAAKVLNIVFGHDHEDRNRRERSLREARATARINHPNVVRVYDYVEDDDRLWIVMELLAARSLDAVVDQDGPLSPKDAAAIGVQLARALRTVHDQGVLHRDVKPGNVLIEPDGHTVLTDFGIAALEGTSGLTGTGMMVGSPEFMAPERIDGDNAGPASDLWSLGVTLCAAVTGTSPFRRSTPVATLAAIVINAPEVPPETGPLAPLLRELFLRDPEGRPNAAQVLERLEAVLAVDALRQTDVPTQEVTSPPVDNRGQLPPRDTTPEAERPTALAPLVAATPVAATPVASATAVPGFADAETRVPDAPVATVPATVPVADPGAPTERYPRVPAPPPAHEVPAAPPDGTEILTGGTAPQPRPWWRRRPVVLSASAAAVAAIVVAAVLLSGGGGGAKDKASGANPPAVGAESASPGPSNSAASPSPSVSAKPQFAPYPTAEPTAAPSTPTHTVDEKRFTWPVPDGWNRAERDLTISYVAPGRLSVLAARTAFKQTDDLLGAWRDDEAKAPAVLADYTKISFEQRTIRGNPGVVWEYTWVEAGVPRHAVLAAFIENGLYVEVDLFSTNDTYPRDTELFQWALRNLHPVATGGSAPAAGPSAAGAPA
ncbi:serine/threonine-protein kinase [Yinghuangia seranimata]|uniref:serine/threonine-protein kinase n=1 Tax=Yinghuangia seranimata TaxID=408067 RepID=UPI00248B011A|nr:serine/threonine protein kinase [Yinghuangia seranimata]MDI2127518.1 protein kinase [Yinghuangia seranimata]